MHITIKSRLLAALVDKPQAQIMCQKSGKTLIPIDKPQAYFVDVVNMCQRGMLTEMTHLALLTAWNARRPSEPAHLNSMVNLIPLTD